MSTDKSVKEQNTYNLIVKVSRGSRNIGERNRIRGTVTMINTVFINRIYFECELEI
jgi:hypothetical protein